LKPARCHRTTVSGWTRINACLHPDQNRRNMTQKSLSVTARRGWECLRFKTASCCRRAKFSKRRSRREEKNRITGASSSFTRRSMRELYTERAQIGYWLIVTIQQQIAILASDSYSPHLPGNMRATFRRARATGRPTIWAVCRAESFL
jgi:hypothetical protein